LVYTESERTIQHRWADSGTALFEPRLVFTSALT